MYEGSPASCCEVSLLAPPTSHTALLGGLQNRDHSLSCIPHSDATVTHLMNKRIPLSINGLLAQMSNLQECNFLKTAKSLAFNYSGSPAVYLFPVSCIRGNEG